jgi:replicative DNA helicase
VNEIIRTPPHDLQAEMGLLGSLMLVPKSFAEVEAMLNVDDFYDEGHGLIFKSMKATVAEGKPLDPMLLKDRLKAAGDYDSIGGSAYLGKVLNCVPNAAHLIYYADIVADKALARRVIAEASGLLRQAYSDGTEAAELVTSFEGAASRLACRSSSSGLPFALSDSAKQVIDRLKLPEGISNSRAFFGVRTIDEGLGPILGGEVCIVAARTSMGKTSLVQGVLRHAAFQDKPSLLVSLEMQHTEIASRELSRGTAIQSRRIRNNELTADELEQLSEMQRGLVGVPFYTWSPSRATFSEIRSYAIHAKAKLGIQVLGIDYIGLIAEPSKFRGQRRDHLAEVSRGCKQLAKELDIPLFVLCQLNRDASNEVPQLSNLRECGAIEEDADHVLMIYQDESDDDNHRHLKVAKFRAGAIGDIRLGWDGARFEFGEPDNNWKG